MPMTVGWIECLIITIRTPSMPNLTIAVGTGEATVKSDLLHLASKDGMQICTEFVVVENLFAHNPAKIVTNERETPSLLGDFSK